MSAYRGRQGPNLSQFLNDLNTVSPPYDPALDLDLTQDLSLFTNTDFTSMDDTNFNFDLNDVNNNPGSFEDFLGTNIPQPNVNQSSPTETNYGYSNYNTPLAPAPAVTNLPSVDTPNTSTSTQNQSRKKAGEFYAPHVSAEEKSRLAAEEDKRRRNTAASARFRVKKKQREQALEKNLKEVQEKSARLESRLGQLEMENKWLRALITEKNGMQSKEEMIAAYQKYRKDSEERDVKDERESSEHTTGVGTD